MEGSSKATEPQICGICEEATSKYCCPRCNVLYCSLTCYKAEKHIQCSESFYKDCIKEGLSSMKCDDESRDKMKAILKRMTTDIMNEPDEDKDEDENEVVSDDNCESDDEEAIDLEERMKGLDLDDADAVWSALTDDERNDFQALLDKCNGDSIVPQWEPWWMYHKHDKLVEEVTEENEEEEALKKCPPFKTVPAFSSLTKIQPSPAIKFNIGNVLASYVFVMRHFNGDPEPLDGVACLLEVCANLNTNANFEDLDIAVTSVMQRCRESTIIDTDEPSLKVMQFDTYQLLRGPSKENRWFYCNAALSHLLAMLRAAKRSCRTTKHSSKGESKGAFSKRFPDHIESVRSTLDETKIKKITKKVEYYLSYVQSYGLDT